MLRKLLILLTLCTPVFAVEDYTTYSTGGAQIADFTITSTKISCTSDFINKNEDAWVYDDKGAGHFSGDFSHDMECQVNGSSGSYGQLVFWMLANAVGDPKDLADASESCVWIELYEYANQYKIRGHLLEAGVEVDAGELNIAVSTQYSVNVARDDDAGDSSKGRYTVTVTGVGSFTMDSSAEQNDFRYIYGMSGRNTGSAATTYGFVQNLDLNEEAPSTPRVRGRISIIGMD